MTQQEMLVAMVYVLINFCLNVYIIGAPALHSTCRSAMRVSASPGTPRLQGYGSSTRC